MKKTLFIILLFTSSLLFSQNFIQEEKPIPEKPNQMSFRERLIIGGGFGMQFGTYTNIEVAPLVGFRITEDWIAGGGFSYQFISSRSQDLSTSIYGPRVFTNYMLIGDFFAHLEYESLNIKTDWSSLGTNTKLWVESYLVGGGYRMRISDKSSVNLMLLYNLNESIYLPYSNPIIRIGFYL